MQNPITASRIMQMIGHWLGTPVGSYLGSTYGNPQMEILQKPMNAPGAGDAILAKMREDLPVLQALPAGAIDIFLIDDDGIDRRRLEVRVYQNSVSIDGSGGVRYGA